MMLLIGMASSCWGQEWVSLPASRNGIDWSTSGIAGPIPARATLCARLTTSANVDRINAALASCRAGEAVYLEPGTYSIAGTIRIPSNVTLRGAGAQLTVLKATGTGGGAVISMGFGDVDYAPVGIVSGAVAGSEKLNLSNVSGIHAGGYLVITESNNPSYVSTAGSGGNCNWCDGGWTANGSLARGQIVEVTKVSGTTVTISPGLYSAYTKSPIAVPFHMSAKYAGVEDLQIYAMDTGYATNVGMSKCAYCWVKGVESNYADGDHVEIHWGFRDEVRDSYFSNAFLHRPGAHDSDIQIGFKTSASRIENNIIERTHAAVMLEWGASGNVISYNYTTGEFDSGAVNLDIGGIVFHGAHPQFNLLEGNVVTKIEEDPVWGSSSHTTAFRNWIVGTNRICSPTSGRGAVACGEGNGHYGFQAARAVDLSYLTSADSYIANVVGSAQMQSLVGYRYPLKQSASVEFPSQRNYDAVAYGWSLGYGSTSDDGTGTGCGGGTPPCHRSAASSSDFFHGNFSNITGLVTWAAGVTRKLPASLYLISKPGWWSFVSYPATGPDVSRGFGPGGYSYGNPAQACYFRVMKGSDGGAGGPLAFDPNRCYKADNATVRMLSTK